MTKRSEERLEFLINVAYYACIVGLVYIGFKYVLGWVLPFILAFCIVSLVRPAVTWLDKRLNINHKVISFAILLLAYLMVGGLLFLLILVLIDQVQNLLEVLPQYYVDFIRPTLQMAGDNLARLIASIPPTWYDRFVAFQGDILGGLQNFLFSLSDEGLKSLSRFTGSIPAFFIAFMFTIMLSFFVSLQYDRVIRFFADQLSPRGRRFFRELRSIITSTVISYAKAVCKLMVITFLELSVGLLALGTQNAVFIAAGIALFDALPVFGTGAIMIPWVIVVIFQGNFSYALGLGILYVLVTVVRNIIEPKIVGDKLGLNPIVSMVSIYLGYKLIGVFGMIIMPIITQVAMAMHQRGIVKLFRERRPAQRGTSPE